VAHEGVEAHDASGDHQPLGELAPGGGLHLEDLEERDSEGELLVGFSIPAAIQLAAFGIAKSLSL